MRIIFLSVFFMIFSIQGIGTNEESQWDEKSQWDAGYGCFKAIESGDIDLFNRAIKQNVNINSIYSGSGISFIMQAILSGQEKIVDRLLELGVNLNYSYNSCFTDDDRFSHSYPKDCSLLMFHVAKKTIEAARLMDRFMNNHEIKLQLIEKVIKAGANVNTQNSWGQTPLMFALYRKDLKLIELFVKYGALIDLKDIKNETVIDQAKIRSIEIEDDEERTLEYNTVKQIIEFLEKTKSENIKLRKKRLEELLTKIRKILEQYIPTGQHGPTQHIIEYLNEEVEPIYIPDSIYIPAPISQEEKSTINKTASITKYKNKDLRRAIKKNDQKTVRSFLESSHYKEIDLADALNVATYANNEAIVKLLLEHVDNLDDLYKALNIARAEIEIGNDFHDIAQLILQKIKFIELTN